MPTRRSRIGQEPAEPKLTPGTYRAVVTNVKNTKGYVPGDAVTVEYQLTDEKTGQTYPHSEVFYQGGDPPDRTKRFWALLDRLGFGSEWDELVGYEMELELLYGVKDRIRYLNTVVHRFYLKDGGMDDDSESEN